VSVLREIGADRFLIDLGFRDTEGLIASYLLPLAEGGYALVETGPASCRDALLAGLHAAGIEPGDIRKILVTHIHLDHAGASGWAARTFTGARLYAHREGVPHLVDPTRLIASARRAWGEGSDALWGPIVPVPPERVEGLSGGETVALKDGPLEVIATPGHARHHLAFFDRRQRAMLTGDGAGVWVHEGWRARPAVPPPDIDLEQLFRSLDAMAARDPAEILYSHFGPRGGAREALRDYRQAVEEWRDVARAAAAESPNVEHIARALEGYEREAAARSGRTLPDAGSEELISGYRLAAQGLLRYLQTHGEAPKGAP
jgi:glyoxylase-like metal-dependent hydrolase (beta-lactamase superfamily II)